MANRHFRQFSFGLEPMPVRLAAKVTATATQTGGSAQTLTRAKGITSVTAAATGLWTITLADPYVTLLGIDITWVSPDGSTAPAVRGFWVKSEAVATASSKTIVIQLVAGTNAAAATAPNTGDVALIEILLNNSSAL